MNPYAIIAALFLWGGSVASAAWWFYGAGRNAEIAIQAREDRAAAVATEAAASAAAAAISQIEVKQVTIRQRTEHEIQTNTVYRDCRLTPNGLRDINASLTGQEPTASELPASGAHH